MAAFRQFYESPWSGAIGAMISAMWEAACLIGPPIGIETSDHKSYLVWAFIAFVVCSAQSFWASHKQVKDLSRQLQEIDEARPRIKAKLPDAVRSLTVNHVFFHLGTKQPMSVQSVPFLQVAFHNDPLKPFPHSIAKGVRAFVEFTPEGKDTPSLKIDGRWAENDQPPARGAFESKSDILETSFGFGESHNLDIAYISGTDGMCYAWNNDNYANFDNRYLTPSHLLPAVNYEVRVRLRGEFVDEVFKFKFTVARGGFTFSQPASV